MTTPTGTPQTTLRLDELENHHCGKILSIETGDDEMVRLMAMGICTGRIVELISRGDPLILKVYGTRLGVSARLARRVTVEPCEHQTCPLL